MKIILLAGLTLLFLTGCEKSNIDAYQDYVGVWINSSGNITRTLEVKSNGNCYYEEVTKSGNNSKTLKYNGKFVMENSTLKIGVKKFTINKKPTLSSNGTWLLVMDSNEFVKN